MSWCRMFLQSRLAPTENQSYTACNVVHLAHVGTVNNTIYNTIYLCNVAYQFQLKFVNLNIYYYNIYTIFINTPD